MDDQCEKILNRLDLPQIRTIALNEIETAELLRVKNKRTKGEYCWTITPFTFDSIFNRSESIARLTYIDADLFFFDSAQCIFEELEESGKEVLITEHGYDPVYDQTETSGRFCVQFITVNRSPNASKVINWWKSKCIEWCYARIEKDRFGDQKYLDQWPELFPKFVHIYSDTTKTLAPWNVRYIYTTKGDPSPVFYHFHGFRRIGPRRFLLWKGYRVSPQADGIYSAYIEQIREVIKLTEIDRMNVSVTAPRMTLKDSIEYWWLVTTKKTRLIDI